MFNGLVKLIAETLTKPDYVLLVGIDQEHPHVLHFKDDSTRRSVAQRFRARAMQAIDVYRWLGREYRENVPSNGTGTDAEVYHWLEMQKSYEGP